MRSFGPIVGSWLLLMSGTALGAAHHVPQKPSAPADTIPVPVQPVQRSCESLRPASVVNGRPVTLNVEYCGVVTISNGKRELNYRALVGGDGREQPVWPMSSLVSAMDEYVSNVRTAFGSDVLDLTEACADDSVVTKPQAALNCGLISLINADYDRAGNLLLRASKSMPMEQCATGMAAVLVLRNRAGTTDWVETRSLVRSLLRSGSPVAKQLLEIDDQLGS